MKLVFEVAGDRQIERELLRVGDRAGDVSPAFSRIVDLWTSETRKQFESAGAHASGGWQPLKRATVLEKARAGLDNGILRRTFALERSLTDRSDPNMLLEIGPDELAWGSRIPYADVHQRPKPTNPVPRRRPVEFTESARRGTVKILQRFVMTGVAE